MSKKGDVDPSAARAYAQECARRAAIRNPKYRDKMTTEIQGKDGAPIELEVKRAAAESAMRKLLGNNFDALI